MREFNLEEGYPTVGEAMGIVKGVVSKMKKGEIIVFIHGYGSSGKGGKIRKEMRAWLLSQNKEEKVSKVIFGEDFDMFNLDALILKNKEKNLLEYYRKGNQGITIIEK